MSPGLVRWHPRACGYGADRNDHDGRLVVSVTQATPAPLRLPGWSWRGWERGLPTFLEPEDRGPVPGRLELRWPLAGDQLQRPSSPGLPGRPTWSTPPRSPWWSGRSATTSARRRPEPS